MEPKEDFMCLTKSRNQEGYFYFSKTATGGKSDPKSALVKIEPLREVSTTTMYHKSQKKP